MIKLWRQPGFWLSPKLLLAWHCPGIADCSGKEDLAFLSLEKPKKERWVHSQENVSAFQRSLD